VKRKIGIYILLTSIGFFLLYSMASIPIRTEFDNDIVTLLCILFGFLIEWRKLLSIIKNGVKLNWLIVPSISLLIFAFFSLDILYPIIGTTLFPPIFSLLQIEITRTVIFVFTGILLVRALSRDKY